MNNNPRIGSTFDNFLTEHKLLEEVEMIAKSETKKVAIQDLTDKTLFWFRCMEYAFQEDPDIRTHGSFKSYIKEQIEFYALDDAYDLAVGVFDELRRYVSPGTDWVARYISEHGDWVDWENIGNWIMNTYDVELYVWEE